jgi:hypothetical protein
MKAVGSQQHSSNRQKKQTVAKLHMSPPTRFLSGKSIKDKDFIKTDLISQQRESILCFCLIKHIHSHVCDKSIVIRSLKKKKCHVVSVSWVKAQQDPLVGLHHANHHVSPL